MPGSYSLSHGSGPLTVQTVRRIATGYQRAAGDLGSSCLDCCLYITYLHVAASPKMYNNGRQGGRLAADHECSPMCGPFVS